MYESHYAIRKCLEEISVSKFEHKYHVSPIQRNCGGISDLLYICLEQISIETLTYTSKLLWVIAAEDVMNLTTSLKFVMIKKNIETKKITFKESRISAIKNETRCRSGRKWKWYCSNFIWSNENSAHSGAISRYNIL